MLNQLFWVPFLTTFLLSFLLGPVSIFLARRFKLIDDPRKNKHVKVLHKMPTPRGGVIGISTSIILCIPLFLPIDNHIKGIIAGVVVLTVMGVLDDKYNLNPYLRLPIQFFAALLPIATGIGIAYITNPFGGIIDLSQPQISFMILGEVRTIWVLSDVFALLWIVGLMNFINWGAKGVPGQLSGVVGIAALVIAVLSLQFSADIAEWPVTILASILAGAYLGFLRWHIFPQRIMPGFGGSNVAGFLLGVLAILTTAKVGILLVVLGVPLIDSTYTVIRRIKNGKSPVWGDRGHLHHKLIDLGWSQEAVSIFYWFVTGALGILALNMQGPFKLYTMISIAVILAGFSIWIWTKTRYKH